jgi:(p)ppGpp synthase/HD superfamily hydrolase
MTRADGTEARRRASDGDWVDPPEFVFESDVLSLAFFVAARAHEGHTRGGRGRPYLEHPIEVAELLRIDGCDEAMIAAGLLHDVVENSGLTVGDVVENFGVRVGELVAALTEDPSIDDWEERKEALRGSVADAGPDAAAIYVADKLANLSDWSAVYSEMGEAAVEYFKAPTLDARIRAWRADLEMAERVAPALPMNGCLSSQLSQFVDQRRSAVRRVSTAV